MVGLSSLHWCCTLDCLESLGLNNTRGVPRTVWDPSRRLGACHPGTVPTPAGLLTAFSSEQEAAEVNQDGRVNPLPIDPDAVLRCSVLAGIHTKLHRRFA